jgi:excisionase family DNA binding protein
MESVANLEPIAVKGTTAAKMLDCGATTIWRLVKNGTLETIKIGSDTRITVESIRRVGTTTKTA